MKTNLQILIATFFILFSIASASAQQPQPAPINPETGLPEPVPAIDPATGLPEDGSPPFKDTNGVPTWISPAWKDPDVVLDSVEWPNYPLAEVLRHLRQQFLSKLKIDYFDIILPNAPGFDPTDIDVDLQLINVKASEIFSAMNMQFELNKSPYRWELTMNGSRPTALLRILPQLVPQPPPPPQPIRKVLYVGDMLDEFPGTNDLQKLHGLSDEIFNVWDQTRMKGGADVEIYPPGQSLIVSGTPDAVDLAEQTLHALSEKAEHEKSRQDQQPAKSQ